VFHPKVGDPLETGETVGEVHAQTEDAASEASRRMLAALTVGEEPVEAPPLVHGWLD